MTTEKTPEGILLFPNEIAKLSKNQQVLVEKYGEIAIPAHQYYQASQKEGPWPADLSDKDFLPDNAFSPYTRVRRLEDGSVKVYNPSEVQPYKKYLCKIADRMESTAEFAQRSQEPTQAMLISTLLRTQALYLRKGDFEGSMVTRLNASNSPEVEFFIGALDTYTDTVKGVKEDMQVWVIKRDNGITGDLNKFIQRALGVMGSRANLRVTAGDMLLAAGLTADSPWSGNTAPSEDSIRITIGGIAYLFINVMSEGISKNTEPAIEKYTPDVKKIKGWESKLEKAIYMGTALHEAGHGHVPFDGETRRYLGAQYMALKELLVEEFACAAAFRTLSSREGSIEMAKLIVGVSHAKWRSYIDRYEAATDSNKTVLSHYAWAGNWRTNFLERDGAINVNSDNGQISVVDWEIVKQSHYRMYSYLEQTIRDQRHKPGSVEAFIELNSKNPRTYMIGGFASPIEINIRQDSSSQALAS